MGTMPSASEAMALNAPTERSSELALLQVGQTSWIWAATVFPLLVFLMVTHLPQRSDCWPKLGHQAWSMATRGVESEL